MAWTYVTTLLTDRDKVRFLIGDTDTNDQLLSDEEIAAALTTAPRVMTAAADCCRSVAAKFARYGSQEISLSYRQMERQLRQRAQIAGAMPYAGGISLDDIETVEADVDRPLPHFNIGMMSPAGNDILQQDTQRQ